MHIGNIEGLLVSVTIASVCNKILRKRFLQPDTIGLILTGGYTCNNNYSRKDLMWLLHKEQADGMNLMRARNDHD